MKWIILFIGLTIAVSSCYRDKAPAPVPVSCNDTLSNNNVSFSTQIVPILQTNCTDPGFGSCHQSGSVYGDFTTYGGIQSYAYNGQLVTRVVVLKDMPLASSNGPTSLSVCDIAVINNWVKQGALNN